MTTLARAALLLLLGLGVAAPAWGFDAAATYAKGAKVLSLEAGYGERFDLEGVADGTEVEFFNTGVRLSWLPFEPVGPGPLHGALEIGLEPFYQRYLEPSTAFFAGAAAVLRYHFLSLGRLVPYVEVAGAAGGTDLRIREIDSDFTFLVFGGAGASIFVTDHTAVYAGYRLQHVSNGNTDLPNRGFESHTAVVGVSLFFR
ncbi:MAG TPA: acyloxyacyl hydrolase [Methylomirabilota bacterium]|nr:acyloxyacyl hydrolase [Methylomirabilota bacterium]